MKPKSVMLIAGEPSGDTLGAELVNALRIELSSREVDYTPFGQPLHTGLEPGFFGAGGPRMAAAGVELAFNLVEHSIIGIPSWKNYRQARQRFNQLLQLAIERQPDVIVGIDYNYFNLKFAHAIRERTPSIRLVPRLASETREIHFAAGLGFARRPRLSSCPRLRSAAKYFSF